MTSPCNIISFIITFFMLLFNILCYFFIIDLVSMHIQVRYTIIINSTITQYVLQSNIINKPTLNRHSNRHFHVSEKKSPKELLSPQIIFFFIEGSPVDNPTVLQNRGTMGVQIPSTFPKTLILSLFRQKYGFWANYSILLQVYSYNSIRKCSCSARFT